MQNPIHIQTPSFNDGVLNKDCFFLVGSIAKSEVFPYQLSDPFKHEELMKKEKYLSMIPPALLVTAMVASPAVWANVTLYGVADVGLFSTQQKIAGVQERTTGLVSGGQAASR
ncbi:hypothetical protein [Lampropedia hyalina]|nr:hypothetical protein [Lampropedia hyalina]